MRNTSTILNSTILALLLWIGATSFAQIPETNSNFVHPDYDYFSVEAHAKNAALSGPFLNLFSNDAIQFEFDVFTSPNDDLHYSIFHCDPYWNIDDSNPMDVIQGFTSQRLPFPENSIHTTAAFDHYRFELPNNMTKFIQSGNYYVVVHEGSEYSESNVRLGFRMVVYAEGLHGLNAELNIKRASTIQHLQSHQEVDFSISLANTPVYDMNKVLPVILQNGRWKNGKTNFQPTYIAPNNVLVYDYSSGENEFPG
ncbi:MAG: type IX secretion system plug protein domain-containing protein, partial [Flavobacteriales bacterium]